MAEYKLLTKDFGAPELQTLSGYEKVGGYQGLRDAFKKFTPETLVAEVKTSNIRGRGGAGFPTGPEVVVPPQGRVSAVPVLQRGRVGAGMLQGPIPHR